MNSRIFTPASAPPLPTAQPSFAGKKILNINPESPSGDRFEKRSTRQQALQGLEHPHGETANRLRALFNHTGDPDYLNPFLPIRSALQHDPKAIERYEETVNRVRQKLDVQLLPKTMESFETESVGQLNFLRDQLVPEKIHSPGQTPDDKDLEETHSAFHIFEQTVSIIHKAMGRPEGKAVKDESLEYLLAASLTELYLNRPDMLDRVLERKTPLRILISEPLNPQDLNMDARITDGLYLPGTNMILLEPTALWKSDEQVGLHEFNHSQSEQQAKVQGTLPQMTPEQQKQFRAARQKMKDHPSDVEIDKYAFKNDKEFLTMTLGHFTHDPGPLVASPGGQEIYDIYRDIFKLDPIALYKKAGMVETSHKISIL